MKIYVETELKEGYVNYPDNYSLTGFACDALTKNGFIKNDRRLIIKNLDDGAKLLKANDWGKHQSKLAGDFFKGVTRISVEEV